MYYSGFSYTEAQNLSVPERHWYIRRIKKEFDKRDQGEQAATRGAHQNTADVRAMQNRNRQQVPSRLTRFT